MSRILLLCFQKDRISFNGNGSLWSDQRIPVSTDSEDTGIFLYYGCQKPFKPVLIAFRKLESFFHLNIQKSKDRL